MSLSSWLVAQARQPESSGRLESDSDSCDLRPALTASVAPTDEAMRRAFSSCRASSMDAVDSGTMLATSQLEAHFNGLM